MREHGANVPAAVGGPYCLTVSCPSRAGQVAAIAAFLEKHQGYIREFAVYDDPTGRFFVRCVYTVASELEGLEAMREAFVPVADAFEMEATFYDMSVAPRVVIMVSKLEHCLADLLFRVRMRELNMNVVAIGSNHPDLKNHADAAGIPYHYMPVGPQNRQEQEAQILKLMDDTRAELLVLARYMQILTDRTSRALSGRAINIHHSFLPGFKGAKPYHQAYERGVKIIGATAHFVTEDLDEGPIIEQSVHHVDHSYSPDDLLALGRNMESHALARAVRYFVERRIFMNRHRTIVLR
ncbi:MAG: formyltetrahydrofolate deformylase [Lautropia sp.]|nr:formyltetrahydrofolate deformylase [Lautropia sp.]